MPFAMIVNAFSVFISDRHLECDWYTNHKAHAFVIVFFCDLVCFHHSIVLLFDFDSLISHLANLNQTNGIIYLSGTIAISELLLKWKIAHVFSWCRHLIRFYRFNVTISRNKSKKNRGNQICMLNDQIHISIESERKTKLNWAIVFAIK